MLNRSERYKGIKRYKKRCRRILFLSVLLTIAGVIAVDYSINNLMANDSKIKVVSFEKGNSKFEINIMNYKFNPNSDFMAKLADQIKNVFN